MPFDFRDLFIFEMANNHQGRVEHGLRIIREMGRIAKDKGIRAAIKFQFRHLDTFIPSMHIQGNKHIRRFLATQLSKDDFACLIEEVRKHDLITMATPFDEASLDLINDLGIEVVKIGSCSATDWPLIREIAELGKPVVFSTGGLTMRQIDDVSSFFDSKGVHHAIMHCVALYPTPAEHFQLNQIGALCRLYPNKVIGLSSHESKWQRSPISIAYAQGARIFERHVGAEDKSSTEYGSPATGITLNAYSADAEAIEAWLEEHRMARMMCGATERPESTPEEQAALLELKRSVAVNIARPDPIRQIVSDAIYTIKGMLAEAKIALPPDFKLELSHHHGLVRFPYVGATIIEIVNRAYCKKLIVLTPEQCHPNHYHDKKEETFHVLSGTIYMALQGQALEFGAGETVTIKPGEWHTFGSESGAIIEEISTTHMNDDSFYSDPLITALKREERKTIVEGWGAGR